jgi:hypothetical protein
MKAAFPYSSLLAVILVAVTLVCPLSALAQIECAGTLTQQNFHKEISETNQAIQKNVLSVRKLEAKLINLPKDSPEIVSGKKELQDLKKLLADQKITFETLNSQHFPITGLTALGLACSERRWVERAKEILIKHPDKLGQHYFVWMDKGSREIKAAKKRPSWEHVAR